MSGLCRNPSFNSVHHAGNVLSYYFSVCLLAPSPLMLGFYDKECLQGLLPTIFSLALEIRIILRHFGRNWLRSDYYCAAPWRPPLHDFEPLSLLSGRILNTTTFFHAFILAKQHNYFVMTSKSHRSSRRSCSIHTESNTLPDNAWPGIVITAEIKKGCLCFT